MEVFVPVASNERNRRRLSPEEIIGFARQAMPIASAKDMPVCSHAGSDRDADPGVWADPEAILRPTAGERLRSVGSRRVSIMTPGSKLVHHSPGGESGEGTHRPIAGPGKGMGEGGAQGTASGTIAGIASGITRKPDPRSTSSSASARSRRSWHGQSDTWVLGISGKPG